VVVVVVVVVVGVVVVVVVVVVVMLVVVVVVELWCRAFCARDDSLCVGLAVVVGQGAVGLRRRRGGCRCHACALSSWHAQIGKKQTYLRAL
jgi:hypothetical protein